MNIKTENVCPPIPNRNFDWRAYDDDTYDGPGSPLGEGPTKEAAIANLIEKIGGSAWDWWFSLTAAERLQHIENLMEKA